MAFLKTKEVEEQAASMLETAVQGDRLSRDSEAKVPASTSDSHDSEPASAEYKAPPQQEDVDVAHSVCIDLL
jgi:hypothetical protein